MSSEFKLHTCQHLTNHFIQFTICKVFFSKTMWYVRFSSVGNVACNLISALIILYLKEKDWSMRSFLISLIPKTLTGSFCWLPKAAMAWFALPHRWTSSIWYPHQLWGALVKSFRTTWFTEVKDIIWWSTSETRKNSRHLGDFRCFLSNWRWPRELARSGNHCC